MKKKVFKKYRNEVIKLEAGVLVPAKEDPHGCYSKLVYEQRENGISIGRFKRMNRRWKRLKAVECMAGDFGWWNKYPDALEESTSDDGRIYLYLGFGWSQRVYLLSKSRANKENGD